MAEVLRHGRQPAFWCLWACLRRSSTFLGLNRLLAPKPLWIDFWCTPHRSPKQGSKTGSFVSGSFADSAYARELNALSISFVTSLKACAQTKDLKRGSELHAEIGSSGVLGSSRHVGNTLISMYAKCGALSQAQQVLHDLQARDVVSWSAMIAGFAEGGQGKEALECYEHMQKDGFSPDAVTFASLLKACSITQDLFKGKKIHDEIIRHGLLDGNIILGSGLVHMYAKCGAFTEAKEVLKELPETNVEAWSAIIAGFANSGNVAEALSCFHKMRTIGLIPCAYTYSCILKTCRIIGAVDMGESICKEVVSMGLLQENIVVGTAAVDMYAKWGFLSKAQMMLDILPMRTVICWNALIAGYVHRNQGLEALQCYERLQKEGLHPDVTTYAYVIKACGILKSLDRGKKLHEELASKGLLKSSLVVGNALVDMYIRCGQLLTAWQVLTELPCRDIVSWSTLLGGYTEAKMGEEALLCYNQLQREGLLPNEITYVSILKACSIMQNPHQGRMFHIETVNKGFMDKNTLICNALLYMYASCRLYLEAKHVLLSNELLAQNVTSWNALLSGYAQHEKCEEILCCHVEMQRKGVSPDAISYTCILKACGITKELDIGKGIHNELVTQGLLGKSFVLGNALVNMYAKCGMLQRARKVFEELPSRDVIAWSALIGGYVQHGQTKEALECFHEMQDEGLTPDAPTWNTIIGGLSQQGHAEQALCCFQLMQQQGIAPDAITLLCVLNACSHLSLIAKGMSYFENMYRDYGIAPGVEHQACMISLFARLGQFDRALKLVTKVLPSHCPSVWSLVLGACKKWGNLMLGRVAFEHAVS